MFTIHRQLAWCLLWQSRKTALFMQLSGHQSPSQQAYTPYFLPHENIDKNENIDMIFVAGI